MKKYLFIALTLSFQIVNAAVDPNTLVKVSPENTKKCVEYYNFQGDMYCSTTPQGPSTVDPAVKKYEKLKITFDHRPWKIGWGEKNETIQTVEYVTGDESVENWSELITSSYMPGMQKKVTPIEWAENMIDQLKNTGFKMDIHYIKKSPSQVIFEFRVLEPENQQQDELQMITGDDTGIYVLHYVIKKTDMGDEAREKWIKNLENSTINPESKS